ncbi:hypothetical protein PR048_031249 [Dryococelus australis]|uniref:Uncharacterized protein n=1 Tax=Dryococelus australis TaxID=614101 RepID=A0ABQ9G7M1_9NEOP|nr:hypothetical protein PR048_031249 [Dryococelus australis]
MQLSYLQRTLIRFRSPERREYMHRNVVAKYIVYTCSRRSPRNISIAEKGRLACSPLTTAKWAQSPAGPLPDFRMWESCQTMPLVGGFSQRPPVSPAFSFRRCHIFTAITLIGSQDLAASTRCLPGARRITSNHDVFGGQVVDYCLACRVPTFQTFETQEGIRMIDHACVCEIPFEDSDLRELVLKRQIHRHTHTCKVNNEQSACRFNFPRKECAETLRQHPEEYSVSAKQIYEHLSELVAVLIISQGKGGRLKGADERKVSVCFISLSLPGPRWLSGLTACLPQTRTELNPRPGHSRIFASWTRSAGWRVFSGISRLPRPCITALLHCHLISSSSALKTQISQHYRCPLIYMFRCSGSVSTRLAI